MNGPFDRAVQEHGVSILRVCRATLGAGPDANAVVEPDGDTDLWAAVSALPERQ